MNVDDVVSYARSIKPIEGAFPQKPSNYNTARQWLNYGYKLKDIVLANGGQYFAMKNEEKGFKYYSKNEVEQMTIDERKYYELKYNHREWNDKQNNNYHSKTDNKVMGTTSKNKSFQKVEVSSKVEAKNIPVGVIPYNPKSLNNKIALFINVETTGDFGKGSPKYGDEIVSLSILRGNFTTADAKMIYNENFKPRYHTSWKVSEYFHGVSPKDVENAPYFEEEKRHIQATIDLGEVIVSYGDENFKFLEESGIYIPKKSRLDVKEMFFKHHPEVGKFSFSNFLKTYSNEKNADIWENGKEQPSKKLSGYKTFINFAAAIRQYKTICNELKKVQYQKLNSNEQKVAEEEFER